MTCFFRGVGVVELVSKGFFFWVGGGSCGGGK